MKDNMEQELQLSEKKEVKNKTKYIIVIVSIGVVLLISIIFSICITNGNKKNREKILDYYVNDVLEQEIIKFISKNANTENLDYRLIERESIYAEKMAIECNYGTGGKLLFVNNCEVNGTKVAKKYVLDLSEYSVELPLEKDAFIDEEEKSEEETINKNQVVLYKYLLDGKIKYISNSSKSDYGAEEYEIKKVVINCESECSFTDDRYSKALITEKDKIVLYDVELEKVIKEFFDVKYADLYLEHKVVLQNKAGKYGIYDYVQDIMTVPYNYDSFEAFGYDTLDPRGPEYDIVLENSIIVKNNDKYGMVDISTGEITLDIKYDEILCYYSSVTGGFKSNYCKVKQNGLYEILKYDKEQKKLEYQNLKVDDFYGFFDDNYAYVKQNNNLELIDLKDNSIVSVFENIDSKYTPFILTNYIDDNNDNNVLIQFDKNDDSDKCIEYYYNENTKQSFTKDNIGCAGIAKPVLYLYPEEKTNVIVNFEKIDLLTITYPKFKDKWQVIAYPNGDLYDKQGKYYYGLYWEEVPVHRVSFDEGFYVEKDNAIEFLEEKLSIIGLNNRERNEFIMYWLPVLERNGKNLIYFELTKERESYNKLEINPKPDSLLRITMHVKKVNEKPTIKEQKLTNFKRTGFAVVEWGGWNY